MNNIIGGFCEKCNKFRKRHCDGNRNTCMSILFDVIDDLQQKNELLRAEVQKLAKAKEEGRFSVPPVQVGDKIYHIRYSMKFGKKMIFTYTISEVMYFSKRGKRPWLFETYGGFRFDNLDIGKTVFLTREEAEKTLGGGEG